LVVNPSTFMRASNVRLYASSACEAFHENRPAFQKELIALLKPILGTSSSRRQAVEGICNGTVPSWWRDPSYSAARCPPLVSAFGSDPSDVGDGSEDSVLMEAIQLSRASFIDEVARNKGSRHDIADSSSTYTLKVSAGSEMRRLTVNWLNTASTSCIFDTICRAICESFGNAEVGTRTIPLVYVDDDGDECTLVASTVEDFLTLSNGRVLKLRIGQCAPQITGVAHAAMMASEEFSISTPRSLGLPSAEPSDFVDVEPTVESADEGLDWAMIATSSCS